MKPSCLLLLLPLLSSPLPAAETAVATANRVVLWNGSDVRGWSIFINDTNINPNTVWNANQGVLRLATKASGYLRTEKSFSNYRLHVEWRWPKDAATNSNSGVLLHLNGPDLIWPQCFECQLKSGNAGQFVGMGLDIPDAPLISNRKRAPRLAAASEKPFGEWNTYEIHSRSNTVEVFVNGTRQNFAARLPVDTGSIALQMEGFPIEFQNVWLDSL